MIDKLTIRPEAPGDASPIYHVNQQAFARDDEADLVDNLRNDGEEMLSLVGVIDGQIIGHILFTEVTIEAEDGEAEPWTAQGLGPIAVLPAYQGQGVGSRLMEAGLDACRRAGHEVVFLLGHPSYYPRFGFQAGAPLGLRWEGEAPEDAFMVLELTPGALQNRSGIVRFLPQFEGV